MTVRQELEARKAQLELEGKAFLKAKAKAPENCLGCLRPLIRLRWNTKGDILVCDNPGCRCYREPRRFVAEPRGSMDEVNRRAPRVKYYTQAQKKVLG